VNSSGNPHLAQGGSGDTLAGFLAGLLAQPALQTDAGKTIHLRGLAARRGGGQIAGDARELGSWKICWMKLATRAEFAFTTRRLLLKNFRAQIYFNCLGPLALRAASGRVCRHIRIGRRHGPDRRHRAVRRQRYDVPPGGRQLHERAVDKIFAGRAEAAFQMIQSPAARRAVHRTAGVGSAAETGNQNLGRDAIGIAGETVFVWRAVFVVGRRLHHPADLCGESLRGF